MTVATANWPDSMPPDLAAAQSVQMEHRRGILLEGVMVAQSWICLARMIIYGKSRAGKTRMSLSLMRGRLVMGIS